MNEQFYRMLNYDYQKKRDNALRDAEVKKQDAYNTHPQLQEFDDRIRELGFQLVKLSLKDSDLTQKDNERLLLRIKDIKKNKEELLKNLGVPPDCFEPIFECKLCNDSGYIEGEKSGLCSCYKQKLINLAFRQSNLCIVEKENFKTFNPEMVFR